MGILLQFLCLIVCSQANDVIIRVTSPAPNLIYHVQGMRPGVAVDIFPSGGPMSIAMIENPDHYQLCVDYDIYNDFVAASCKLLTSNVDLASLDLFTLPPGEHVFSAFIQPVHEAAVLSHIELDSLTINVPYATGPLTNLNIDPPEWVISFHYSHDAHVAALHWGEPVYVLELERLVEQRYFTGVPTSLEQREVIVKAWKDASVLVSKATGVKSFDIGVYNSIFTQFGGTWEPAFLDAMDMATSAFNAKRWVQVDHHRSHAALGLWDAARELEIKKPLILSYDGGGNDGITVAYAGNTDESKHLIPIKIPPRFAEMNFGNAYAAVGAALPEVARRSCPIAMRQLGYCNDTTVKAPEGLGAAITSPARLAFSGKLMGYAGLGTPQVALVNAIEKEFEGCSIYGTMINSNGQLDGQQRCMEKYGTVHGPGGQPYLDLPAVLTRAGAPITTKVSRRLQRNIAASAQKLMENQVTELIAILLADGHPSGGVFDGIVITGGCALNVRVNSVVSASFALPVHVAAAPSDCGLAIGSGWLVYPPSPIGSPFRLHLLGPTLFDVTYAKKGEDAQLTSDVETTFESLGAFRIDQGSLADLLTDDQVIGVVRGHSEHGPRALGHRSLLSFPSAGMKERMNALKEREWYRPVAPMVAEEEADAVFVRDSWARPLHSPFMSFAPYLLNAATLHLPAITHADNSARPQTVSARDDEWLHALLLEVKKRTGWAVLINTSFNTKGKPILNTVEEALLLLRDCEDLDYVLIEDFLFPKSIAQSAVDLWQTRRKYDSSSLLPT